MIHLKAWLVNDLVSVTLGPLALDTQIVRYTKEKYLYYDIARQRVGTY